YFVAHGSAGNQYSKERGHVGGIDSPTVVEVRRTAITLRRRTRQDCGHEGLDVLAIGLAVAVHVAVGGRRTTDGRDRQAGDDQSARNARLEEGNCGAAGRGSNVDGEPEVHQLTPA